MCQIASLFLLQRLKGSMSGNAYNFNNIETWANIKVFFLQGKTPKDIHAILTETFGEHAPLFATVKKWVSQFECGDFSTCDAPCPGQPKTVTTAVWFIQGKEFDFIGSAHNSKITSVFKFFCFQTNDCCLYSHLPAVLVFKMMSVWWNESWVMGITYTDTFRTLYYFRS